MRALVVDHHPLVVDAITNILRVLDPHTMVIEAFSGEEGQAQAQHCGDLDLVVLDLGLPRAGGMPLLKSLRTCNPLIPIAVLSGENDPDLGIIAIRGGASGFILKSSRREIVISALRLIMSGGIYFPPEVVGLASTTTHDGAANKREFSLASRQRQKIEDCGISKREIEVLELLVAGYSNKVIAQQLQIAECTVKAHVTSIFRALQAASRTQLIYYVTNGHLA